MTHPTLTHISPERGPSVDDPFFTLFRRQKSGIKCEISCQILATNSPVFRTLCSQSVSSATQSCPTLCDPVERSMPGSLVHHELPEGAQTHVHRVDDAIQPAHPLSCRTLCRPHETDPPPARTAGQFILSCVNAVTPESKNCGSVLYFFLDAPYSTYVTEHWW